MPPGSPTRSCGRPTRPVASSTLHTARPTTSPPCCCPRHKRPYIHALYGFARYADDIVDDLGSTETTDQGRLRFESWSSQFLDGPPSRDQRRPVGRAVIDTVRRWDIPHEYFEAFLRSMSMDLTVTEYADYDALYEYVYGSAAVIGLRGAAGPRAHLTGRGALRR